MKKTFATLLAGLSLLALPLRAHAQNNYTEVDLVSDISGRAARTDTNLVNPWGIVPGPSGVFWVSNNGKSNSTLYQPDGTPLSLIVTLPGGDPTGVTLANRTDLHFTFPSGDTSASAVFIFVNQVGHILVWSPTVDMTHGISVVSKDGASYTGVALASTGAGPRLYAANFGAGTIDVYDHTFTATTTSGTFTDANLPSSYAPFNVANIGGQLYVAYAQKSNGDEVHGAGLGIIDVYDTNGNFMRRLVSDGGPLNAPWGMVRAPGDFGDFSGDLLVGDLGDGRINAFSLSDGSFRGALRDASANPISLSGLWGLSFGNPVSGAAVASRLYFAAGIEGEAHGLFGYLGVTPATLPPPGETCDNHSKGLGFWTHQCGVQAGNGGHGDEDDSHRLGGLAYAFGHARGRGQPLADAFEHVRNRGHDSGKHGPESQVAADSLDALFGCVAGSASAFGGGGCFTAGCDLLSARGPMSATQRLAQHFLVLMLNRCAGLICDANSVTCRAEDDGDDEGDDDQEGGASFPDVHTVGDVIALVNHRLCASDLSRSEIGGLMGLVGCAMGEGAEGDDDDDQGEDLHQQTIGATSEPRGGLQVKTLSGNPLRPSIGETRLQLSSDRAVVVQFGVYDAQGRLVARLLRDVAVAGSMEVRWNGRNLAGERVAPGTYFYRATGPNAVATGRIVVLK